VAANIIPPEAYAELVYRLVTAPEIFLEAIRPLVADAVEIAVLSQNPPMELTTLPGFATDVIAFNTDAYYLARLAPVYLIGPGDIRLAHADREHIPVADLIAGIDVYVRLVTLRRVACCPLASPILPRPAEKSARAFRHFMVVAQNATQPSERIPSSSAPA
jgi:hypothetical protein